MNKSNYLIQLSEFHQSIDEAPNLIKAFSRKSGKSVGEVERLWNKAKDIAKEQGRKEGTEDFYKLTTGILKKMLKIS